jgi:6-phosphogluconolactonase
MSGLDRRSFLGVLGAAGIGSLLPTQPAGAAEYPWRRGGRVAYVGSYTSSGSPPGRGLDVATRHRSALRAERTVADIPDASWFAFSADRRTLYVTNERLPEGSVTALSLRDPHAPRVLSRRSSLGGAPTHTSVHPAGRHLLTANYGDGTVAVHPILPDGGLGEATDLVRHTGTERQAHAHQVVTDPSGRWVLAVDLGADSVYVYRLDIRSGTLGLHRQVRLPVGAGPRHLAFHPRGRFVYILGELRAEITVADWDPARGELNPEQVVPTVASTAPAPQYPAEIAVSRDGRFVYATNRGEDTIATFAVRERGREIARLRNVPTGGVWPRHFTLDASQRWFYVSNQRSGTVTWLPRDPASGLPGEVAGSLAVPSVATVAFR